MGKHFANKVHALVSQHAANSYESGGRSHSDIMDEMRDALGFTQETDEESDQPVVMESDKLYDLLSEDGPCPTKDQMQKIAPVLGTSVSSLMEAAKQDGCSYQSGRTGKNQIAAITRHNGSQFG